MKRIFEVNELANVCGYFYNAVIEKNFCCNNGYNCKHEKQEEVSINEETGERIGMCYAWSCPLGYEADKEDFKNPNIDKNGYSQDDFEEMKYIVIG